MRRVPLFFRLRSCSAALVLAVGAGSADAQDLRLDHIGTFGAWDVRAGSDGDERICVMRALHEAIGDGDVFWIYRTRDADRYADGYLALDPRFLPLGGAAAVAVDDIAGPWPLTQAADGFSYAAAADAPAIAAAFRAGLLAEITIAPNDSADRTLTVSLHGFTAASVVAGAACSVAADP